MSNEAEERLLRKTYSEVINGFSVHRYRDSDVYIKHFSSLDNLEIDYLYTQHYEGAVARGFPTEADRIDALKKDGLWCEEKEIQIKNLKLSLSSIMAMKRKAYLKRDIDSANKQIAEQNDLLQQIVFDKEATIGATAEKWARKKVDAFFISKSFFKDRELKTLLYTQEEFDDLDKHELEELYNVFYAASSFLGENKIKAIAVKDFFINIFSLAESLYEFFGRPISTLTFYQVQLCAYGNFFKTILTSDPKPPEELTDDPEKLEDWFYGRANAEEVLKKVQKDGGNEGSLVGLTPEDRAFLGYENPERVPLFKRIQEAGGELSMAELIKIDGA